MPSAVQARAANLGSSCKRASERRSRPPATEAREPASSMRIFRETGNVRTVPHQQVNMKTARVRERLLLVGPRNTRASGGAHDARGIAQRRHDREQRRPKTPRPIDKCVDFGSDPAGVVIEQSKGSATFHKDEVTLVDKQATIRQLHPIGARPWPGYAPLRPDRAAASSPIRRRARGEADG
jgi:hypothetical protein